MSQPIQTVTRRPGWSAVALIAVAMGCAPAPDSGSGLATAPSTARFAATVAPSGFPLNGTQVGGVPLRAVDLQGIVLGDAVLTDARLVGSDLRGRIGDREVSGVELSGAILSASLVSGERARLRIYGVQSPAAPGGLTFYRVASLGQEGWRPICSGANEALAVPGVWDYRQGVPGGGGRTRSDARFTLSCRGAAIAQCAELGYHPWRRPNGCPDGVPCPETLEDHHQACVRMHRADYCGDGRSFTVGGIFINVYGSLGIQRDAEPWIPEAEWGPGGAGCIRASRVLFSGRDLPPCALPRPRPDGAECASPDSFRKDALLINELNQQTTR